MRIASPSRLMMVARKDKEARLKDFIVEGLARRADAASDAEPVTIFVRNPDSPVARALFSAVSEGRGEPRDFKILFGEISVDEPSQASLLDFVGADMRHLGDARFGAAHEQLVVSDVHIWIGDCLRRDPTKRDAFEIYHADNASVRAFGAASFRKLWAIARPVTRPSIDVLAPAMIAAAKTDDGESTSHDRHQ